MPTTATWTWILILLANLCRYQDTITIAWIVLYVVSWGDVCSTYNQSATKSYVIIWFRYLRASLASLLRNKKSHVMFLDRHHTVDIFTSWSLLFMYHQVQQLVIFYYHETVISYYTPTWSTLHWYHRCRSSCFSPNNSHHSVKKENTVRLKKRQADWDHSIDIHNYCGLACKFSSSCIYHLGE